MRKFGSSARTFHLYPFNNKGLISNVHYAEKFIHHPAFFYCAEFLFGLFSNYTRLGKTLDSENAKEQRESP
jgi:hypothetical protein